MELTKIQNEIIQKTFDFKPENRINKVYSYWFNSIIASTEGGAFYKIEVDGEIEVVSYHDVTFDQPIIIF